jgi:hypothetical protein
VTDDELAVELVDEPAPRPPRRWPQAALLLAAVAVVVGVGMFDDGSDETSLPTTTTTTSTIERTTTTRRVHRVTTTEVVPHTEPGDGPLLPDAAGTHVVLVRDAGRVDVVDLATGSTCVTTTGDRETWMPNGGTASAGAVALQTSSGLVTVDAGCAVAGPLPVPWSDAYPSGRTDDAIWMMTDDGTTLTGIGLDGAPRQTIDLPPNGGAWISGAGQRLVVAAAGSITLVDPATGSRRDLGTGTPVAATADAIAVLRCPRLTCALSLVDLDTGRRRLLAAGVLGSTNMGALSADGRHLAVTTNPGPSPHSYVVDLRTNETTEVDADMVIGFTSGSRWLLAQSGSDIVAFRPDGSDRQVLMDAIGTNGVSILLPPR